jgi:hypothetical protein
MTARARKLSSFSSNSPVRLVEGLAPNRHCMGDNCGSTADTILTRSRSNQMKDCSAQLREVPGHWASLKECYFRVPHSSSSERTSSPNGVRVVALTCVTD